MTILSISLYSISLILFFFMLFKHRRKNKENTFYFLFPIIFLFTEALYVLPLLIRYFIGEDLDSSISPYYQEFKEYLPHAVIFTSAFNFFFTIFFFYSKPNPIKFSSGARFSLKSVFFLVLISGLMIYQIAAQVGGFLNLVLLGYSVTEKLSSAAQFSVGFDWLVAASIALLYSGFSTNDKKRTYIGAAFLVSLILIFSIMGRRGVLVVLMTSALIGYHVYVKKISLPTLSFIGIGVFLLLNLIGLTRGDEYESISSFTETTLNKGRGLSDNENISLFYTLTEGNFAVPFETFPQVIKSLDEKFELGYGAYSLRGLFFLIPSFLWENRPVPLANWYMDIFYGVSEKRIGRQFFILSGPYMDFGAIGIVLFGCLMGWFFKFLSVVSFKNIRNPMTDAASVLFLGSMLNFVPNDAFSFFIVFFKSYGIPLLFLHFASRVKIKI